MRLLLFDVDGTLITSSRVGRRAMGVALTEVFGTAGALETYNFAGKTDRRIIGDLLAAEGWERAAIEARLPALYERMVAAGQGLFTAPAIGPCPGVLPLLELLSARADTVLGLLTGNISHTVPLKLRAAGIDPELFRVSAFGSDRDERNDLLAVALERAREVADIDFPAQDVVIIGDTPADIACARAGGAKAVAVATGPFTSAVLGEYRPDHLFEDLAETDRIVRALYSAHGGTD